MRRAVVIGGGEIGAGWAALFASHGVEVSLVDPDIEALERARAALTEARSLGVGGERPGAIAAFHDFEAVVPEADWIQEATPEILDLKQSLFARVDSIASGEAIIASSTSSLTRAQLSQGMRNPSRLLIVHPLHPVYAVSMVEVNADPALPRVIVDRALDTLRGLGRDPVLVAGDLPGLVANRLTAALLREAVDLIGRGIVSAADLDRVVARGIATGWVARGPLRTELLGARLEGSEELLDAIGTTLAPLWSSIASWAELDGEARAAVERELSRSLGGIQKAHAAGESTWAKTLSRVARAAEAD